VKGSLYRPAVIVTGHRLGGPASIRCNARFMFSPQRSNRQWDQRSLLQWVTEDSSSGAERSHIEVDHSRPFSAKVELYLAPPLCLPGIKPNQLKVGINFFMPFRRDVNHSDYLLLEFLNRNQTGHNNIFQPGSLLPEICVDKQSMCSIIWVDLALFVRSEVLTALARGRDFS
jgi:hypothetical protein